MGKKSRRKGKEGELEVARILYRAHYGEEPPKDRQVFVRTKPGVRQVEGDLIVPDDFGFVTYKTTTGYFATRKFYVEVKNRSICLTTLMHSKEWKAMIFDAARKAEDAGRLLLFVFKVHGKWWVLMNFVSPIANQCFRYHLRCDTETVIQPGTYRRTHETSFDVYLIPLENFAEWWAQERSQTSKEQQEHEQICSTGYKVTGHSPSHYSMEQS